MFSDSARILKKIYVLVLGKAEQNHWTQDPKILNIASLKEKKRQLQPSHIGIASNKAQQ